MVNREMQIKTTKRYHLTPIRMATTEKTDDSKWLLERVGMKEAETGAMKEAETGAMRWQAGLSTKRLARITEPKDLRLPIA